MSAIHKKKRDLQPETVQVAKRQAERLAELFSERGVTLKRSEALEAVARLHGARDWNTFRAGLTSDEVASEQKPAPSVKELRRFLALDKGGSDLCARRIIMISGPGPDHAGMWGSRSANTLEALLPILFIRAGAEGRGPSIDELRRAMTLEGALDLYDWFERERPKDTKLRALHMSLSIIPGFNFYEWRQTRTIDPKASEQYRFSGEVWIKAIDDLISGDIPIPAISDLVSHPVLIG